MQESPGQEAALLDSSEDFALSSKAMREGCRKRGRGKLAGTCGLSTAVYFLELDKVKSD